MILIYRQLVIFFCLTALLACEIDSGASGEAAAASSEPVIDSIDALVAHVEDEAIGDGSALLASLPVALRQNALLVEAGSGPHQADLEHPRIVLFAPGARLLLSLSSDPSDPRHDVVDVAELEDDGRWRFRALDLAGEGLADEDRACTSCHGSEPRPIWGSYPEWPGVFGDDTGSLDERQVAALAAMVADSDHRVAALAVDFDEEARTVLLADRYYAQPTTAFNLELGAAAAEGIATRLRAAPDYARKRHGLLLADTCWVMDGVVEEAFADLEQELGDDSGELRRRLYESLGLDPQRDLSLEARADAPSPEGEVGLWSAGSSYLYELVDFLVLDDLLADDAELAALFADVSADRERILRDWWTLEGDARRALFRSGSEIELSPQDLMTAALGEAHDPRRRAFCERLARGWLAADR